MKEAALPIGAIGSFISIDRLQRAFLPVSGESESQTSVMLLSADGVIADQETANNTSQTISTELDRRLPSLWPETRAHQLHRSEWHRTHGRASPVEYPGAQWAVAVTGPSPANYGPNESLVRNSLIALATAVAVTLLLSVIFRGDDRSPAETPDH